MVIKPLAFVNNLANVDAPTVAYVTVYSLTTWLRILVTRGVGSHDDSLKCLAKCCEVTHGESSRRRITHYPCRLKTGHMAAASPRSSQP